MKGRNNNKELRIIDKRMIENHETFINNKSFVHNKLYIGCSLERNILTNRIGSISQIEPKEIHLILFRLTMFRHCSHPTFELQSHHYSIQKKNILSGET